MKILERLEVESIAVRLLRTFGQIQLVQSDRTSGMIVQIVVVQHLFRFELSGLKPTRIVLRAVFFEVEVSLLSMFLDHAYLAIFESELMVLLTAPKSKTCRLRRILHLKEPACGEWSALMPFSQRISSSASVNGSACLAWEPSPVYFKCFISTLSVFA